MWYSFDINQNKLHFNIKMAVYEVFYTSNVYKASVGDTYSATNVNQTSEVDKGKGIPFNILNLTIKSIT